MGKRIAIICEGEKREVQYFSSLRKLFFQEYEYTFLALSAKENLYMLWNQLKADDFETDVIELLRDLDDECKTQLEGVRRDSFQEIYLFFDYDPHQNNSSLSYNESNDIVKDMLEVFDNETENGKLYISYPMCEALRDFIPGGCRAFGPCVVYESDIKAYKRTTGDRRNHVNDVKNYDSSRWMDCIRTFLMKSRCLYCLDNRVVDDHWYKTTVNPLGIYEHERNLFEKERKVFVLSAFPAFLVDYFPAGYFQY